MISKAKDHFSKTLFTDRGDGEAPVYIEAQSDNDQSQFVAKKILEHREAGIELKDMAILIRSGWHSNDLEIQLRASNIPFMKFGGFRFAETSHIKDVVAFLGLRQTHLIESVGSVFY